MNMYLHVNRTVHDTLAVILHGDRGARTLTIVMAQLQLRPPDPFDFKAPDGWTRWRRRFEQYRVASGLAEGTDAKQVSTLLYCLGEEAESVLMSTNITTDERAVYETVLGKFDSFFQVRRNVIFERARFNRRNQLQGETAEQYITTLYTLVANCNYGALQDEMLRDRLVVGIRDTALSERLQLDAELTLEKAKKAIRQREAVHEQQYVLKGSHSPSLEALHPSQRGGWRQTRGQRGSGNAGAAASRGKQGHQSQSAKCTRCGKEPHPREKCPAKDVTCRRCQKKGHYGALCLSKSVGAVEADSSNLDLAFLDSASSQQDSATETAWFANVQLGEADSVRFKLDTGAEVTAISHFSYQQLSAPPPLNTSDKALYGPARNPLQVLGQCVCHLSYKGKACKQQLYVVEGLKNNLLGLPAISALNIAARLDNTAAVSTVPLTTEYIHKRFQNLFKGLGTLGDEYEIKLKPDAKPYALYASRNVPLPLREKVTQELERMEAIGVISKVDVPTPWCAGIVPVPKKSGAVRICVDLKPLNQSVLREVHPIPRVDDTLAQLTGAKRFSKLDANSGFWQIPLSPASRLLTTFIAPSGRYCFNKPPFGISSAPELFQKRMSAILAGLDGIVCQMDDVLVHGSNQAEHDARLLAALERIESAGVTLNPEKCEFGKDTVKFLGHVIDSSGIHADPDKTSAIQEMEQPRTIPELRRLLGMVNQLGKFTPNLAHLTQPLRALLGKNTPWVWGPSQSDALLQVKTELSKPVTLALYDPAAQTKVSADASSYGLGAVLLQRVDATWKPVAYASRSLSETEQRYAQIEKEALAITWACEKFAVYLIGKSFSVETDHKPLVPLLGTKHLHSLPPRILRFRLRLDRFDYTIQHVPGKDLHTADALSRAPSASTEHDTNLQELAEMLMVAHIAQLPASKDTLDRYRSAQLSDPTCSTVMQYCRQGWPEKNSVDPAVKPYWEAQGDITIGEGLLLFGGRIGVPSALQEETLQKLHHGHQGIERCRLRAQSSVWWPGISKRISELIKQCPQCSRDAVPNKEPLISTALPEYPWQRAGTDLFTLNHNTYVLVVDYYSQYPEAIQLRTTTSQGVITALKSIFARHGIPETLVSDNGPQYSSHEFAEFAELYGFVHSTSSPHYPQSNGHAERAVQTVKKLLKESPDPSLALLSYRATPLPWCGYSPAELSMGRRLRTDVPQASGNLLPQWPYVKEVQERDTEFKRKQKENFDRRHRVRPLPELPNDTGVWVTTDGHPTPGRVLTHADAPRSYVIEAPSGPIRRNRGQLNVVPNPPDTSAAEPSRSLIQTRTRTGTQIHPPNRL